MGGGEMAEALPLIYDCDNTLGIPDCDVDDGLTLLYLLGSPGVKLLAVTCSFGNSTQEKVFHNTVRLLREWGREDILVLRGGANPANRRSPAAEFLADAARRYPDRLAVLATGSLTNLLGAESYDPDFFSRVARISLMGGVTGPLLVGGRPMAELNCSVDAQAAHGVLTRGREVLIATAQNCLDSFFPREEYMARLALSRAPLARYLERELAGWFQWNRERWGLSGFVNWDVLAAAQLLHPEYFHWEAAEITPTVRSLGQGQLLADGAPRRAVLPRIRDRAAYAEHVYSTILAARVRMPGV